MNKLTAISILAVALVSISNVSFAATIESFSLKTSQLNINSSRQLLKSPVSDNTLFKNRFNQASINSPALMKTKNNFSTPASAMTPAQNNLNLRESSLKAVTTLQKQAFPNTAALKTQVPNFKLNTTNTQNFKINNLNASLLKGSALASVGNLSSRNLTHVGFRAMPPATLSITNTRQPSLSNIQNFNVRNALKPLPPGRVSIR